MSKPVTKAERADILRQCARGVSIRQICIEKRRTHRTIERILKGEEQRQKAAKPFMGFSEIAAICKITGKHYGHVVDDLRAGRISPRILEERG